MTSKRSEVVPFSGKPTITIKGSKYVLSDYWPAMDVTAAAKLVEVEKGPRYRYLWVYDTDRKNLVMWRVSDGDEKVNDHGANNPTIYVLDKRKQLNRVSHEKYLEVSKFMGNRNEEFVEALIARAKALSSDFEKQSYQLLLGWLDNNVRPNLERRISDLEKDIFPLGFKVNDRLLGHHNKQDQARNWLVSKALEGFTVEKAYTIVSKIVGFDAGDPPEGIDNQAVQWAWSDVVQEFQEEYSR